jgi:hypothetical protein
MSEILEEPYDTKESEQGEGPSRRGRASVEKEAPSQTVFEGGILINEM